MLLPGLINLHVHAQAPGLHAGHGAEPILPGTGAHFLQAGLREALAMGVTTYETSVARDSSLRRRDRRCATARFAGLGC